METASIGKNNRSSEQLLELMEQVYSTARLFTYTLNVTNDK